MKRILAFWAVVFFLATSPLWYRLHQAGSSLGLVIFGSVTTVLVIYAVFPMALFTRVAFMEGIGFRPRNGESLRRFYARSAGTWSLLAVACGLFVFFVWLNGLGMPPSEFNAPLYLIIMIIASLSGLAALLKGLGDVATALAPPQTSTSTEKNKAKITSFAAWAALIAIVVAAIWYFESPKSRYSRPTPVSTPSSIGR